MTSTKNNEAYYVICFYTTKKKIIFIYLLYILIDIWTEKKLLNFKYKYTIMYNFISCKTLQKLTFFLLKNWFILSGLTNHQ